MKKLKIIIPLILLIIGGLFMLNKYSFLLPVSNTQMKKEYNINKELFQDVADYLIEQKYSSISIRDADNKGEMYASGTVRISDDSVSDKINTLFTKHEISVIFKDTDSNSRYVCFQRYANRDIGKGLLFSKDGTFPKKNNLTELEKLDNDKWYLYEES